MKVRDVIKILEEDGWYLERTRGSHRQYKHLEKKGTVTVNGKPSNDVAMPNLMSIIAQSGIAKGKFR